MRRSSTTLPYPSLTLAVVESQVPGGHAPAYLAILNQPLPTTPFVWRDDPAAFDDYPDFFVAHEVAHQWWGQAVGWKNYHEQWLSEGLAQYFAALYAEHQRGPQVFQDLLRQMVRWTDDTSALGPVSLGYRLAYLKGAGKTFRALVYNKGAVVMHMLRRMLGDDVFFRALRRFYDEHRFQKAGTDDLRAAFEKESGKEFASLLRSLDFRTGSAVADGDVEGVGGRGVRRRDVRAAEPSRVRLPDHRHRRVRRRQHRGSPRRDRRRIDDDLLAVEGEAEEDLAEPRQAHAARIGLQTSDYRLRTTADRSPRRATRRYVPSARRRARSACRPSRRTGSADRRARRGRRAVDPLRSRGRAMRRRPRRCRRP